MVSSPSRGPAVADSDSSAPSVCPERLVFLSRVWNGLARRGQGHFYLWLSQVKLLRPRGYKYLPASLLSLPLVIFLGVELTSSVGIVCLAF